MKTEQLAKGKILLSMIIFGTIGLLVRSIHLPSSVIALARAAIGSLFLLAVVFLRGGHIDWQAIRKNLPCLLLSGSALGFNWILLFASYNYTTVAVSTLCYYMAPIFVILTAPLILRERLTVRKIICVIVALFGMVCLSGVLRGTVPEAGEKRGILLGLAAAVLYASIVMLNKQVRGISAFDRTIFQLGLSAVLVFVYCLFTVDVKTLTWDTHTVLLLLLAGMIHTGLAYYLYFGAMEQVSGQSAAMISYIDPAVAVLISVFILGEPWDVFVLLGAVLILGSALASELPERKKTDSSVKELSE